MIRRNCIRYKSLIRLQMRELSAPLKRGAPGSAQLCAHWLVSCQKYGADTTTKDITRKLNGCAKHVSYRPPLIFFCLFLSFYAVRHVSLWHAPVCTWQIQCGVCQIHDFSLGSRQGILMGYWMIHSETNDSACIMPYAVRDCRHTAIWSGGY